MKTLLTKRQRRYAGALIAAVVTTFVGLQTTAEAEPASCTLRDATAWQIALNDPEVEHSPAYIRSITEAFLGACPERPEFFDASRIAGIAAADMGDAATSVQHFQNAGQMSDLKSNFYAVSAYLAIGDETTAWRLRDMIVERWRSKLERQPSVSLSAEATEFGMVYQVQFSKLDRETQTRAAWVGVPYGAGWPATLSFSRDRMRVALQKISAGEAPSDVRYIDLNRCHGRRALGQIEMSETLVDFDSTAHAGLTAYMANPDIAAGVKSGDINPCIWPRRLLPQAPRR